MKFVICSGRQAWGGTIALHALCKYISEEGYDARILNYFNLANVPGKGLWPKLRHKLKYIYLFVRDIAVKTAMKFLRIIPYGGGGIRDLPKLRGYVDVSVEGCRHKYFPFPVDDDTIVVYPEVIRGNFLKAKNVVRWFLFFNRFPNDDDAYEKHDLFFSYSKKFNDPQLNPECRICTVSYFNWNIYKRTNFGKREGTCYIVRKGGKRSDLPDKFDGPVIDNFSERKKTEQFNRCKYCVSYDMYTAYSSIAAMLGCISVVVPEPGKTKDDYGGERPGVAFGFDESEIEHAQSTLKDLAERYKSNEQRNRENVKFFIQECKKYFNMT